MKDKPVRINLNLVAKLKELYREEREGVERSLEAYTNLRTHTIHSIKGIFTQQEITGICQSFNGTMMEPRFMCSTDMLLAHFDDSEKLENISSMYSFDYTTFRAKMEKLSPAQAYFLQDEVHRFWNVGELNLEAFINSLS